MLTPDPMFNLDIDRHNGKTIADQIATHIEHAIRSGVLIPGDRLPSWIDLASQLGVARGTIRSAYEKLIDRNMLVTAGSAGTRVAGTRQTELVEGQEPEQLLPPDAGYRTEEPLLFQLGVPASDAFPATLWSRLYKSAVQRTSTRVTYADPRGMPELREAIASHVAIARGVSCCADQIIITSGYRTALTIALQAIGVRGSQAWVEDPGYPVTRLALETMGIQPVAVPVDNHGLDVEKGRDLAPHAALAIVTAGQQAPTGVTLSPSRRAHLLEWAHVANSWLIEDDYLAELQLGGRSAHALAGEAGSERVIHIGTFSKTLSPAIGIGFLIAPPLLARRLIDAATWLHSTPNVASQTALATFLKEGHYLRHLRRMRELYNERRDLLMSGLERAGFRDMTSAGLSVIVPLPRGFDDQHIAMASREVNFGPAPLSLWYSASGRGKAGLLLSVTNVSGNRLDESCQRLKRCINIGTCPVPPTLFATSTS